MKGALGRPLTDTFRGLERCLLGWRSLLLVGAGMALAWWVYVPVHELLHAAGCRVTGGEVRRLEIAPIYGGAVLARLLPFVVAGGDYAGRLSGFDTHGSDVVYLATDFGPFLLTVFPGVWWLRRAARGGQAFWFGAALPVALAPLISATGDAYEIGSILVTRLPPWSAPAMRSLLRGDDLGLKAGQVADAAKSGGSPALLWGGMAAATLAGLAWAWLTYGLGAVVAARAGQPALEAGAGTPGAQGAQKAALSEGEGEGERAGMPGELKR